MTSTQPITRASASARRSESHTAAIACCVPLLRVLGARADPQPRAVRAPASRRQCSAVTRALACARRACDCCASASPVCAALRSGSGRWRQDDESEREATRTGTAREMSHAVEAVQRTLRRLPTTVARANSHWLRARERAELPHRDRRNEVNCHTQIGKVDVCTEELVRWLIHDDKRLQSPGFC